MAVRTTPDAVRELIEGCTTSDAVVNSLISGASALVDKVFEDDTDISATLLEEIERWLTAHMLAVSLVRQASREKVGDAEVEYTGKYGLNLDATMYGQMVKTLDYSGKMANMGKSSAGMFAIPQFDD